MSRGMIVAIIWAIIFIAGGNALGSWVGGTIGTILMFVSWFLAGMSLYTGGIGRGGRGL
jgi:hypothetical protein